jgi:light-independent protochlorophyllide reductase subunit B
MGLEEHLLAMFREDFEFNDQAGASHLAAHQAAPTPAPIPVPTATASQAANDIIWSKEAESELNKIPFFVRGKARRNTERFATEQGLALIKIETLYDAKSHFAR